MSHSGGQPFLWEKDKGMQDLAPSNGGIAWGINDFGEVVGSLGGPTFESHAFIYKDGVMTDLNDLIPADTTLVLEEATEINNKGQIVGRGRVKGGDTFYSFILASPETTSGQLGAGEILSTDSESDGATTSDPVETSVTTPIAGEVSITESLTIRPSSTSGYSFFGRQVDISAPAATPADPLVLKFALDSSVVPAGEDANTMQIFRNGTLMGDCTGASGAAEPDPCVSERRALEGGDIELTIHTSRASQWNLAGSDKKKPAVKIPAPAPKAKNVLREVNVTATFSEEMNPNTVTGSTAKLIDTTTGKPVRATISCPYPCRTVTINPKAPLRAKRTYQAVVSTGAKDLAGNRLSKSFGWTFTTGSS